jgi:DNA-binding response OmpR family regulator
MSLTTLSSFALPNLAAVWRGGKLLHLLPREFNLLEYFMRRPNQIVSRAMLLEDVWHYRIWLNLTMRIGRGH